MPAEARGRRLALVLLVSLTAASRSAPCIQSPNTPVVSATNTVFFSSEIGYSPDGLCDIFHSSNLAYIGKDLFEPPVETAESNLYPTEVRSLPGVPSAAFIVLTGFLCVSLVNDRRIWLVSLAGLLRAGQAGLSAIPQVVSHAAGAKHIIQDGPANSVNAYGDEHHRRRRSDVEGTDYIGLLRRLAGIPDIVSYSTDMCVLSLRSMREHVDKFHFGSSRTLESALVETDSGKTDWDVRSVCATEHRMCFSAGFIFSNLARGPPKASRNF